MLSVDREASCSGPLATVTEEESLMSTATESTTDKTGTALEPDAGGGGGGVGVEFEAAAAEVDLNSLGIVTM